MKKLQIQRCFILPELKLPINNKACSSLYKSKESLGRVQCQRQGCKGVRTATRSHLIVKKEGQSFIFERSETLFSLPAVLCVKVARKVFRGGNRWEKCLKSLHLLRSGSVNTRSSQKRLGRGESAIPLGDTDAHETWSVRPGGDDGGGSAPGGRVRAEQLAQKVSWQRLSQHWLLPKN